MKKIGVALIGSGSKGKGGIASVFRMYFESEYLCSKYRLIEITSHADKTDTKFKKLFVAARALAKLVLMSPKIDVAHIHSASWASFYRKSILLFAAKLLGKKTIFHIHSGEFIMFYEDRSGPRAKKYIRKTIRAADKVVVLAQNWKACIEELTGPLGEKIQVITNPVIFPPAEQRTKLPKEDDKLNILTMGRLGNRKGTYDLIKAAARLVPKYPDIRFILCGDGEIDKVKMIIKADGLEEFFEIPGWTVGEDKIKRYRTADIYTLPAYHEGLPISVLEAAGYSLPIVASPAGGIPDVIKDGETGLIIQPGNIDSIVEGLEKVITDKALRERLGAQAHVFVRDNFTLEQVGKKLDRLYMELAGQNA